MCKDSLKRRYCAVALILATLGSTTPSLSATWTIHGAMEWNILGFDIDTIGTEGILTEFQQREDGKFDLALETFNPQTGALIKIVKKKKDSYSDFLPIVVGGGVGLVTTDHARTGEVTRLTYDVMNPLSGNVITGVWTPPVGKTAYVLGLGSDTNTPTMAVLTQAHHGVGRPIMFRSDVSTNSFGPRITLPKSFATNTTLTRVVYDSTTGLAILANAPCSTCTARLTAVNLDTGSRQRIAKSGKGFVIGMALDTADRIVCTTTYSDFSIEFYNLATQEMKKVAMPDATAPGNTGSWVQFDPVNKLFLIGQPVSGSDPHNGNVQVFDQSGDFVETISGLHFDEYLRINSTLRAGFVLSNRDKSEVDAFNY